MELFYVLFVSLVCSIIFSKGKMKNSIYLICLLASLSFVFNQNKACCKNKNGQAQTSCQYQDSQSKSLVDSDKKSNCQNSQKCTNNVASKKWWKFWKAKNNTTCCAANVSNIKI